MKYIKRLMMHWWLWSPAAVSSAILSLYVQRPALCVPPLTTSGSDKETASLSVINFAIHLHMCVCGLLISRCHGLVWEGRWHGCLFSSLRSPCCEYIDKYWSISVLKMFLFIFLHAFKHRYVMMSIRQCLDLVGKKQVLNFDVWVGIHTGRIGRV